MPKKQRRDPLGFFNYRSVAEHQKNEVELFVEVFFGKKSHNAKKTERGTL